MTYITLGSAPGMTLVPGHPKLDLSPLTTDVPDSAWEGLQYWLTPARFAGAVDPYAIVGPDNTGNYAAQLGDQSRRLKWRDATSTLRRDVMARYGLGNTRFLPTVSTPEGGINGRPALIINERLCGLYLPAQFENWPDFKSGLTQMLTNDYTFVLVASVKSNATGGLLSTGAGASTHSDPVYTGMRLGFINPGQIVYQHTAADADRLIFNCSMDDDRAVLFLVRCRQTAIGTFEGTVRIVIRGVIIDQPFSFTKPIKWDGLAQPVPHLGSQGVGDGSQATRKIGDHGRIARYLGDDEFDRLTAELRDPAVWGPF